MMSSTNTINQTVRSTCYESTDLKMNNCRERRLSLLLVHQYHHDNHHDEAPAGGDEHEHQTNFQDETSKKPQHLDQLSSKDDKRAKRQERQIGDADREDEKEQQYRAAVDSLGPYDVICGRGSVAFNNIGNRRFRILISMNVDRYNNSEGRHRKGLFIGSLVHTFQYAIGARFFKLKDGKLIQLTERQIRQKVGHALRDVLAFQDSQHQQQQRLRIENQLQRPAGKNVVRSTTPQIAKSRKRVGDTTTISTSEATLSEIRSRLREIQKESDSIRPQKHAIPPPLPFTSRYPHRVLQKDLSSNCRGNQSHNMHCNHSAKKVIENSIGKSKVFESDTLSSRRSGDVNYKYDNINSFDRRHREISDSLEPIPIDNHNHQEPDDEALELLKF